MAADKITVDNNVCAALHAAEILECEEPSDNNVVETQIIIIIIIIINNISLP